MPLSATIRQSLIGLVVVCGVVGWMASAIGEGSSSAKNKSGKKAAKVIPVKTLAPLLKSKSEPLWDKGLSKVTAEALEDEQIVDLIIEFVNRESKSLQFSPALTKAISLLGQARQPQATEILAPLLKSDDFRIAMVTADVASSSGHLELIEPIIKLAERPEFDQHYGFRRAIVDAVSRYRDKSAIDFLVKRLGTSDGQLKFEIAMNLQRATGKDFGGKAVDWEKWWQTSRKEFEFKDTETTPARALKTPPKPIPWEEPRPSFYGMTIYAKRVVFVIDRSGSMKMDVDGYTRLEHAQYEVQHAISALSETDSFNVVAFDHEMLVFSPRLVPANDSNKADGIRFALNLTPQGDTACYEPLKMALEASNELELMLFVSDGEPTSGALVEPNAIVIAISNLNITQRTTINTLGIDAHGVHEAFLKNLAEKNGGKLLLIR